MAGSSSSQSTGHSESRSDTYIPEYSESPILREIAQHARRMSDVVYQWGMDTYNKNQGNIDSLMRDALSYASPQRIAVDMGMAEAGVMQAGERGRLSAIRDLESYGIDPSSGRYYNEDASNRVMTAAAAAGAGNQQRMASQAAGNAMRNQAISAGLQNAQFGVAAGESANRYLQTASSLKYPPLGRTSESTSDQQSTSQSQSGDGGGGSKSQQPKEEKPQQEKQGGGGGGQPRQAADRGGGEGKEPPGQRPPPPRPGQGQEPPLDVDTGAGAQSFDEEGFIDRYPGSEVFDSEQELPQEYPGSEVFDSEQELPQEYPGSEVFDSEQELPGSEAVADDGTMDPNAGIPPSNEVAGEYNPYGGDENVAPGAFDPSTGIPTSQYGEDPEAQVAEADPAGAVYGLGDDGGWSSDIVPASYEAPQFGGDQTWSDIGQGATTGEFDSTYDAYTDDAYGDLGTLDVPLDEGAGEWDDTGYGDEIDAGYGDFTDDFYGDIGDYDDWGADESYDDPYAGWGEEDYYDDWGGDEEYYDEGDYGEDYGESYDDPYAEWGEDDYYEDAYGDEGGDYGEEDYDYGEDTEDYGDYEDTDYSDTSEYYEDTDYSDTSGGGGDYDYQDDGSAEYEDAGGDYGGDYARGGPVKARRRNMQRPGGPRPPRRPMTGYRPRPPMRRRPPPGGVPAFARGGSMPPPPPGAGVLTPPPPRPGGRMPRPQQAPRPQRGAPMPARGGPRPTPIGRGPQMPGNFISANGMPAPTTGGMQRPQRMARGGSAGRRPEPTQGGFVSHSLSPSGGSKVDDVNARLNAGEFVIPKDVAHWKGKEFFYKMIAQARKNRSGGGKPEQAQTGYSGASGMPGGM